MKKSQENISVKKLMLQMMASKLRTVALICCTTLQGKSDAKGQYSRHKEFKVTSKT